MTPNGAGVAIMLLAMLVDAGSARCVTSVPFWPPTIRVAGSWRVVHVAVDGGATRTLAYEPDDPRLLGRHILIGRPTVESDLPEAVNCRELRVEVLDRAPSTLFADTLAARNDPIESPTPADFGIDASSLRGARAVSLGCAGDGELGPSPSGGSRPLSGNLNWMVVQSPDRAILHWFDDSLLFLARDKRPADRP